MERFCSSSYSDGSKMREPWRFGGGWDPQVLSGLSWPPRSYSCSFCKREFRSAQALGGHMNVHRRDRARLRQSPPWDPTTPPNPNPNPNANTCVPDLNSPPPFHANEHRGVSPHVSYKFSPTVSPIARLSSSTSSAEPIHSGVEVGKLMVIMKEREMVRLDLEIGIRRHSKEDLDLELRLGYA